MVRVDTNPKPNPKPNHNHNPNPKTAFSKKKKIDPDPGPAFYWHPFAKRIVEEAKPNPHGDFFFFLPKSALFCDKISDVLIFGRPLFQWIEGEVDLTEMRYVQDAVWRSAPIFFYFFIFLLLFLDFHFILEVVVPQDNNRNCWRMLKTTEHHRSSSARIIVALAMDSRPKPPSLSYPAFQCISVHGV